MNIPDLIQDYFEGESAAQLGQAVGLDGALAQKVLAAGLPLQLRALGGHAARPGGAEQILEAVSNLPQFGPVPEVLRSSDGASNLQRAGELLAPVLLGGEEQLRDIINEVTRQVGGSVSGVQKLLYMALPLVLSLLGRQGLNAGNVTELLRPFSSAPEQPGTPAAAPAQTVRAQAPQPETPQAQPPQPETPQPEIPRGLPEQLKALFSGAAAEKIGQAAGFKGNAAARAVQGTLPVILAALVGRGRTETGAGEVLKMAGPFAGLTGADGEINPSLLGTDTELTRVEGQGRGLLGGLFGNVEATTGRLGSALGGSGNSAARLLALMTPLVLSALSKAEGAKNGAALSSALGELEAKLSGLLPAGLSSLGALLGSLSTAAPAQSTNKPVAPPPPPRSVTPPKPAPAAPATKVAAATPTPVSATPVTAAPVTAAPVASTPVTPPPAPPTVTTAKRGGFPWWLLPLLLILLLGGCWLKSRTTTPAPNAVPTSTQNTTAQNTTTQSAATSNTKGSGANPASADSGAFAITTPAADTQLPAGGFTLRGSGKAGDTLEVFQDDTSLGKITVGSDGSWSQDVPSPSQGAHTYSVKGPDGAALGSVATTVAGATAGAGAGGCTKDYTLSMKDGQSVSEPFLFGGVGGGRGYTVTVKRGDRVVGTKAIALDSTCGWSYQSRPGKGKVTYEVRPSGEPSAAPLSTLTVSVN